MTGKINLKYQFAWTINDNKGESSRIDLHRWYRISLIVWLMIGSINKLDVKIIKV